MEKTLRLLTTTGAIFAYYVAAVIAIAFVFFAPLRHFVAEVPLRGWLVVFIGAVVAGIIAARWAREEPKKRYVVEE